MSVQRYVDFIYDELNEVRAEGLDRKAYSDTLDAAGNQYVDLVMEGGGVLGVALLGYVFVLERAGLRFLGLGGTSAGSITALVLGALDSPAQPKAERLLQLLADIPMDTFVDGDDDAKRFAAAMQGGSWIGKLFSAVQVIDNIHNDLGLNPGDAFRAWVRDTLTGFGISTLAQLRERMAMLPAAGLRHRETGDAVEFPPADENLCLIAADLSTETRVELPRMAKLYWRNPDGLHPAEFARASMSVPFFFHPYVIDDVPREPAQKALWQQWAGFDEHSVRDRQAPGDWLPARCLLVDGGVMSNFPIDAFHKPGRVPRRPTFGVKLQWDDRNHYISKPETFVGQLVNSMRHTLDYEFVKRNPDYQHLVAFIDTSDQNWLDFNLDDDARRMLFKRGAQAAVKFLRGFDWTGYKAIREGMAQAQLKSAALRDARKQNVPKPDAP